MAKTVTQAPANDWGGFTGRPETRKVHGGARTTEIPWTPGPGSMSRWQRFKRAAVG